jgi:hypothetical protein
MEALVDCAEKRLLEGGFVRPHEVVAIVAGTRTRSGSTNFLRLQVVGEHKEGERFVTPHELVTPCGCEEEKAEKITGETAEAIAEKAEATLAAPAPAARPKRAARKAAKKAPAKNK